MKNTVKIAAVSRDVLFKTELENPKGCKSVLVEFTLEALKAIPAGISFKLQISDAFDTDFMLVNSMSKRVKYVKFGSREAMVPGNQLSRKFRYVFRKSCQQLATGTPFQTELFHGSTSTGYDLNDEKTHFVTRD
nr:hypothetical protein [uncultured Allomuricauda sp.]